MALIVKDRVQETSSTTGTGTLTLSGAVSGFKTFSSAIGNGNTTYYTITDGVNWEVGIGTVAAGTLSRDTVLSNSLGTTALITFAAGVKNVFVTYPADRSVAKSADLTSGRVTFATTDGVLADSANLVWDGTNVGIGTNTPASYGKLSVAGNASTVCALLNEPALGNATFTPALTFQDTTNVYGKIQAYRSASTTGDLVFSTRTAGTPTEKMRIDSAGNLGLGVTPSAWGSFKAQQIGSSLSLWGTPTASSNAGMMTNTYIDSAGNSIYVSSSYAAHYQQYQGGHYWSTAPSGTAGTTATLTQRMLLDVSGNLGLGVTPSAWNLSGYEALEVGAVGNGIFSGNNDTIITANAYYNAGWKYAANYQATFYEQNAGAHIWKTAATGTAGTAITFTQAMTLNASGNLGIGTTSPTQRLNVVADSTTTIPLLAANSNNNVDTNPTVAQSVARFERGGKTGVTFGSAVDFGISRYVVSGTNARTQMDIRLSHGAVTTPEVTVMSMRSDGNVGIGNTAPAFKLDVSGTVSGTTINASQPFIVNSLTATVSYSIPAGSSASSTGPITVNSGVTITVPSGSRWVVL